MFSEKKEGVKRNNDDKISIDSITKKENIYNSPGFKKKIITVTTLRRGSKYFKPTTKV